MALWDKITSRGKVEDRRSFGPAQVGGGLGLTGLAIYAVITLLSGGSVTDVLNGLQETQIQTGQNYNAKDFEGADSYEVFASTVLGSTTDMWSKVFADNNKTYEPPKLVLFRGSTQSACGGAMSQSGPHYCPTDQTIYLDETFFEELQSQFKAKGGDVAEAYVIAHEVGHHAQNQLGIFDEVNQSSNTNSIKIELEADCFAGLWAYSIKDMGVFMPGEINEAIDAAAAVGDDSIQKNTTGSVHPETWTHGSSSERVSWFNKGYDTGSLSACNTF